MTFTEPQPYEEALRKLDEREVILSPLRSAEWREKVSAQLRDRAFFSSTLENARVAQAMKDFIGDYLAKAIDPETGGLKAQGRAEFVADLRELCIREGLGKLDPETGQIAAEIDEADITDLRSMARLQLIFDTQTTSAHEYGYWAQGNDPDILYAYPAQRFIRIRPVLNPRPIHAENENAVRRKDNLDFWLTMNPDFGVPHGPWGFNSGMGVEDVDRIEAEELGLLASGEEIAPPDRLLNDTLSASTRDLDPDLRNELKNIFGPQIRETNSRMEWTGIPFDTQQASQPPAPKTIAQIIQAIASAPDRKAAHAALELPGGDQGKLTLSNQPKGVIKKHAEDGVAFIQRIVHRDWIPSTPVSIHRDPHKDARGWYESWSKKAFIRKDTGNAAHEIMHHLEHENPALYQAAKAFRLARTPGESTKLLSQLTGIQQYGPTERTYEDEWAKRGGDHYAGKDYGPKSNATEILTMGIEHIHNDPVGFAKDDPDYFQFLIQTLQKL